MMNKVLKRGFTLIELLVVIAIIGILASVVLASLNSARDKGEDAQIKGNLNGLRAQAELVYDDNNNSYAGGTGIISTAAACATTFTANTATNYGLQGNQSFFNGLSAADATGGLCRIINTASMYVIAVQLVSDDSRAWCIDSFGVSRELTHTAAYDATSLAADMSATTGCGS